MAERARRATGGGRMVFELEKLDALHRSGALTDDEFEAAKRRLLEEDES